MIRLAHISDSHFDERGRLADVIEVHKAFIRQAKDAQVDLVVHAGDWFERRSTPAERNAVADFLELATNYGLPVFGVKGNHDQIGDLNIFNRLDVACPVDIRGLPDAEPGAGRLLHLPGGRKVGLLALPWFDKAHLVAELEASIDAEETRVRTIATALDLLTLLRANADRLRKEEHAVPVLVGHVLVQGSETSTGQVLIGTTVELAPADLLDVGCAYAALGHIHKAQEWFGGRVAYSGSPHRCNFGEPEAKGWRLVTLTDEGEFVSSQFKELPARPMVLLEVDFTQNVAPVEVPGSIEGALVRYRYRVRAENLHEVDEAAIETILREWGAAEVQIEAVVEAETRVRAGEIRTAFSTADKVAAYLKAKGIEVDGATWSRLQSKLGELEESCA